MSSFKVEGYWSKEPVECWSTIFQYSWLISNHRWATSRSTIIGRRHRSSPGWWDFSTFSWLDAICTIRWSMGGLVEWLLDGRLIFNGWLGHVEYLYSMITRSKSTIWSWPILVMSRPSIKKCGQWFDEGSQYIVRHPPIYLHSSTNRSTFFFSFSWCSCANISLLEHSQQHINHTSNIVLQGFIISSSVRFEPSSHAAAITQTKWRWQRRQMLKATLSHHTQANKDNKSYTQEQQRDGLNVQPLCLFIKAIFIHEREGWSGYSRSN